MPTERFIGSEDANSVPRTDSDSAVLAETLILLPFKKSALSCNGSKHLIPARVVHKGNGRLTVADEAERDGPHRHALQKVDGSVDGIANPVRGRVFRLFLQGGIKFCIGPAIRGKALRQAVPEQLFCLRI